MHALEQQGFHNALRHALHRIVGGLELHVLRAQHDVHVRVFTEARIHAREIAPEEAHQLIAHHCAGHDVAVADEIRDEGGLRLVVDILRRAELQDVPRAHHGHAVAHGQRFLLIVGDEDEGDAALALDALELQLHLAAELEIQRAQRLIQQQHIRLVNQRARNRHALLLAAGKAGNAALFKARQTDQRQHAADLLGGLFLILLTQIRAEGDVLRDVQMREERVALEHGVDRALIRRQADDVLPFIEDFAAGRLFKAADAAQQRRLAAAGGAEQRHKLVFADVDAHAAQRGEAVFKDHTKIPNGKNRLIIHDILLKNSAGCRPKSPLPGSCPCFSNDAAGTA